MRMRFPRRYEGDYVVIVVASKAAIKVLRSLSAFLMNALSGRY
jgi:hypothetical protein